MSLDEDVRRCAGCGRQIHFEGSIWRADPGFEPEGFSADRRDHLAEIEAGHFWFGPRQRLLGALLDRCGLGTGLQAIDLGCGSGSFLPELARRVRTTIGVDAWPESLARALDRCPDATLIQGNILSNPFAGEQFDLVVALDVLEHVDPLELLREAARLVRPGGSLLLSVPAFPSLWSELDRRARHRCRYRLATIDRELAASGWQRQFRTHYQFLLFPLIWMLRQVATARLLETERHPRRWMSTLLGPVNATEVSLLSRLSLPWGSSLIVLAQRNR